MMRLDFEYSGIAVYAKDRIAAHACKLPLRMTWNCMLSCFAYVRPVVAVVCHTVILFATARALARNARYFVSTKCRTPDYA